MKIYSKSILFFVLLNLVVCSIADATDVQQEKGRQARIKAEREAYEQELLRIGEILTTPRKLRKMRVNEIGVTQNQTSFANFIFVGRANSQSRSFEDYDVVFAWEREPNEYIISRLPVQKIKFQLHPEKHEAEIQFSFNVNGWWYGYKNCNNEINECLSEDLLWATIHISEVDWPIEVSLPLNGGSKPVEVDERKL